MSNNRKLVMSAALALSLIGSGCVARAHVGAIVRGPDIVFHEPPPLVAIEPGIWVVEDYPTTVYYYDDSYWYYDDRSWYRRSHWDGAWVSAEVHVVPIVVAHRDHHRYVHYRRPAGVTVWHEPKVHARARAEVRAEVRERPRAEVRERPRAEVRKRPRAEIGPRPRGDDRVRVRGDDVSKPPPPRPRAAPPRHHYRAPRPEADRKQGSSKGDAHGSKPKATRKGH
jgi:hypothetical protein